MLTACRVRLAVIYYRGENGIALGQIATKNDDGKEVGEYSTIPKLIESLDIEGAVVTIDAGECYTEIIDASRGKRVRKFVT